MPTPNVLHDPQDWPLVPGSFQRLDDEETAQFRNCLRHHLAGSGLDLMPGTADTIHGLRVLPLSFYSGFMLVTGEVPVSGGRVGSLDVLMGPGLFAVLDGTRTLIQALNAGRLPSAAALEDEASPRTAGRVRRLGRIAAAPCYPSPLRSFASHLDVAADYLRFFCGAVRGPLGSFRVLETEAQLRQCQVADVARWIPRLKALVLAPHHDEQGQAAPGLYSAEALMLYGGDLHEALLCVHEGGLVAMLSDDTLAQDLAPSEAIQGPLRNLRPASNGAGDRSTPAGDTP